VRLQGRISQNASSVQRQIRITLNEGASTLYETDNPTEHQFQGGEINTDCRSAYSMHHPIINSYVAAAAAACEKK